MVNVKMIKSDMIKKPRRKMILNQLPRRELILGRRLLGWSVLARHPSRLGHDQHRQDQKDGRA